MLFFIISSSAGEARSRIHQRMTVWAPRSIASERTCASSRYNSSPSVTTSTSVDGPAASLSIARRALVGQINFDPPQLTARLSLFEELLLLFSKSWQVCFDPP